MKFLRLSVIFLLLLVFSGATSPGIHPVEEGVKWYTIQEAMEMSKKEPRKILIDFYTDWCGPCKMMDKYTFANEKIASYINENYYAVKFNPETFTKEVKWQDYTFKYKQGQRKGMHEFSVMMQANPNERTVSYPTTVFLDEELNRIQPIAGFQKPEAFEKIIVYIAQDAYKDTPWVEFEKNYKSFL